MKELSTWSHKVTRSDAYGVQIDNDGNIEGIVRTPHGIVDINGYNWAPGNPVYQQPYVTFEIVIGGRSHEQFQERRQPYTSRSIGILAARFAARIATEATP